MGYNTIAFFLNDHMHELEKSPKTTVWMLTHPPQSEKELERSSGWWKQVDSVSDQYNEPHLFDSAIYVFPTFHADFFHFFSAGWNSLDSLKFIRYGKTKEGKLTVTLELPDHFPLHPANRKKYSR